MLRKLRLVAVASVIGIAAVMTTAQSEALAVGGGIGGDISLYYPNGYCTPGSQLVVYPPQVRVNSPERVHWWVRAVQLDIRNGVVTIPGGDWAYGGSAVLKPTDGFQFAGSYAQGFNPLGRTAVFAQIAIAWQDLSTLQWRSFNGQYYDFWYVHEFQWPTGTIGNDC